MRTERQKKLHREEMRKLRKTEKYKKANRDYQRIYRRTGKGCRRKKGEISIPVARLDIPIKVKVQFS